jgi:hypothetical protein
MWNGKEPPESWLKAITVPLPKKITSTVEIIEEYKFNLDC